MRKGNEFQLHYARKFSLYAPVAQLGERDRCNASQLVNAEAGS